MSNSYGPERFTIVDEEMLTNPYGKHRFTIIDVPSPTTRKSRTKSKAKSPLKKKNKSKSSPKSPLWKQIGRFSVRKLKK
jgi:hypothetical protein